MPANPFGIITDIPEDVGILTPTETDAPLSADPAMRAIQLEQGRGVGQRAEDAFKLENTLAAGYRYLTTPQAKEDPEWGITSDRVAEDAKSLDVPSGQLDYFWEQAGDAVSEEDYQTKLDRYVEMSEAESRMSELGLGANIALRGGAAILDPAMLVGGAAAYKAFRIGKIADRMRRAQATAVVAGTESGIQEAIVGSDNPTRSIADVALATAAGAALGAAGEAAAGLFRSARQSADAATDQLGEIASTENIYKLVDEVPSEQTGPRYVDLSEDGTPVVTTAKLEDVPEATPLGLEELPEGSQKILGAIPEAPMARFTGARFDSLRHLLGSPSGAVRGLGSRLFPEHIGFKDAGYAQRGTATELQNQMFAQFAVPANRAYKAGWRVFAENNGIKRPALALKARNDFASRVTNAVRGIAETDPSVNAVAKTVRTQLSDMLAEGKRAGIFDDGIPDNPNYIPRLFDGTKINRFRSEFGDAGLINMVRNALNEGSPELATLTAKIRQADGTMVDVSVLDKVARGYVRSISRRAEGLDSGLAHGLPVDDVDIMADVLRQAGITDEETIDGLLQGIKKNIAKESRISNAKRRLDISETSALTMKDLTGAERRVSMADILENNIEVVMQRYGRRVSGAIALKDRIGITGTSADLSRLSDEVRESALRAGAKDKEADNAAVTADALVRNIAGLPQKNEDLTSIGAKSSSAIRGLNFLLYMNQVGWASVAEFGMVAARGGLGVLWHGVADYRKFIRNAKTGKVEDDVVEYFEEMLGVGADDLLRPSSSFSRWDSAGDELVPDGRLEAGLQAAQKFSAENISLLGRMTRFQRRLSSFAIIKRFEDLAHKGDALGRGEIERLATQGISLEDVANISSAMKKHGITLKSGYRERTFRRTDLEAFAKASPDLHSKFMTMVQRESNRLIQESAAGNVPLWAHTKPGLWKLMSQFMTFTVNAYNIHTLSGVARRDMQTALAFMYSAMFGSMAWAIRESLNGRGDQITLEEMAKQSVARSAYSSIAPQVVDMAADLTVGEPVFNSRTTGLPSGAITSVPSLKTLDNLSIGAQGAFQALRGDGYSREAFRASVGSVPFLNQIYGLNSVFNEMADDLPSQKALEGF